MSRGFAALGLGLAALFGVATAWTTLQPALEQQRAEREGDFIKHHHQQDDDVISKAIMSDLKEAKEQMEPQESKGFAWGIREAIWGKPGKRKANEYGVGDATHTEG
jgi:hypothetical protein